MHSLYCIEGPTGLYIGITTRKPEDRWAGHKSNARKGRSGYLMNALRKYGEDVFTFTTISHPATREELVEEEKYWIRYLTEQGCHLYNLTSGGESGWDLAENVRSQISKKIKDKWQNDEEYRQNFRKGLDEHIATYVCSTETRERYRRSTTESWKDPNIKEARRAGLQSAMGRPEYAEKQRAAQQAAWADPNKRSARVRGQREALASEEARAKRGAATAKCWADPDSRARRLKALRVSAADPAVRKKRSEGAKEGWKKRRLRHQQTEQLP